MTNLPGGNFKNCKYCKFYIKSESWNKIFRFESSESEKALKSSKLKNDQKNLWQSSKDLATK